MSPLSEDVRQRIVAVYASGEASLSEVATRFRVSRRSVKRDVKQWREEGSLAPKPARNGKSPRLDHAGQTFIASLLSQQPALSQEEVRTRVNRELAVQVSQSTNCRA